jgi:flagellar hook-length control protein FliK
MLAPSAKHETVSASPAAALLGGPGGNKKKGAALAGLFSDILSQAQKLLGAKTPEGAKAQSLLKESAATSRPTAAIHGAAKNAAAGKGLEPRRGIPVPAAPAASRNPLEAPGHQASDEGQARRLREKRQAGGAEERTEQEAGLKKASEEKRRARPAREASAEEAAAIRAAQAASRAAATAFRPAEPKAKNSSDEADTAVEAGRKRDRASEPKLTVLDLRRSAQSRRDASAKADPEAKVDGASKEAITETRSGGQGRELVRDLSLGAGQGGEARSAGKADQGPAAARGQDFQSLLAQRMQDAWNGEIVQSARIVLRDGDAGTIRLRLRPESLGNVKIELNLSDNNISGRILVESDEAKSAFERNMNQLSDAFRQGGFDSARLEVAVGGQAGGGASGNGTTAGDSPGPFYSERLRSAMGSSADPASAVSAYARRGGAVDILA